MPAQQEHNRRKILIKSPNWLGDSVMSIPAVNKVRKLFPQAGIGVKVIPVLADLWKLVPEVDTVISGTDKESIGGFSQVTLLTNSFGSALRMYLARIPERRGYSINARRWLLTQPVSLPADWRKMHQIEYFSGIITEPEAGDAKAVPVITIPASLKEISREFIGKLGYQQGDYLVGIHATASYGSAKCWLPDRFACLINRLIDIYRAKVLIIGGKQERNTINHIISMVTNRRQVINLAGKTTIKQLAGILTLCRVFVSNDSGPMHLAAALGVPVVAIFGSTSSVRTGPRGNCIVIKKDIACSPCFRRSCPYNLECMAAVKVEDVLLAVKEQNNR